MGARISIEGAETLGSAMNWWQLAGVDVIVDDAPHGWLKSARPANIRQAADNGGQGLPATLETLTSWLQDPSNLAALGSRRVEPAGSTAAGLMLLTDLPDPEDCEAGALVSGTAGRLLDAMLGAIGRDRASIYLASLAPGRPATGKLDAALEAELVRIARHHIMLARPRLLLLLGDATIRALTGTGLAQARGSIHSVNLEDGTVPAIATFHPRFLLQQPARKADAWTDLRLAMENLIS